MWRDGFRYGKAGLVISELLPETVQQPALWSEMSEIDMEKRARLWKVVDGLNANLERDTIRILSQGPIAASWSSGLNTDRRAGTTRWEELPKVRAG